MPVSVEAETVTLQHNEVRLIVHLLGATITSWHYGNTERLFVSKKAIYTGPKAIRGGIPVVFPQFGPHPLPNLPALPQHGFARVSIWKFLGIEEDSVGELRVAFSLDNTAIPKEQAVLWPFEFRLKYTIALVGNTLTTTLQVQNNGSKPFPFTSLLQFTYLRTTNVVDLKILGLSGITLIDSLNNDNKETESRVAVTVAGPVDRIYTNVKNNHLSIANSGIGAGVTLHKKNFKDVVVWNPWIENAQKMSDFDDEEYKEMICVEFGHVTDPVVLESGAEWTASQTLVAL